MEDHNFGGQEIEKHESAAARAVTLFRLLRSLHNGLVASAAMLVFWMTGARPLQNLGCDIQQIQAVAGGCAIGAAMAAIIYGPWNWLIEKARNGEKRFWFPAVLARLIGGYTISGLCQLAATICLLLQKGAGVIPFAINIVLFAVTMGGPTTLFIILVWDIWK